MKRFLIFVCAALCMTVCNSQNSELNRLTDIVKSLRSGGQTAFNNAVSTLSADSVWTPMNELVALDKSAECAPSDRVTKFKLNKVLANAEQTQRFETAKGDMLNGEDIRYNYSLYERAVKAGKQLKYELNGRVGEQTFIILPYNGVSSKLSVTIKGSNGTFAKTVSSDGTIRLTGSATKGDRLSVYIVNGSSNNQSFVIINHNSRR